MIIVERGSIARIDLAAPIWCGDVASLPEEADTIGEQTNEKGLKYG